MLKDYYYTDKEELDALRVENVKLKQELNKAIDEIADLKAKLAESERKNFELITKLNLKEYAPAFCKLADRDCEALGQIEILKQQLAKNQKRGGKTNGNQEN